MEIVKGWSFSAIFLRLLLATLVGVVIGVEREYKNRAAGVKTHVLVCIGSALVMITSEYIYRQFPEAKADINRIGAQVVSGVGFLGVGTIIITGNKEVKGLTTAAGLWACACAGLAAGIGFVEGTLIALAFIFLALRVLRITDRRIHSKSHFMVLIIEFDMMSDFKDFIMTLKENKIKYSNVSMNENHSVADNVAYITLELPKGMESKKVYDILMENEHIRYFVEM